MTGVHISARSTQFVHNVGQQEYVLWLRPIGHVNIYQTTVCLHMAVLASGLQYWYSNVCSHAYILIPP